MLVLVLLAGGPACSGDATSGADLSDKDVSPVLIPPDQLAEMGALDGLEPPDAGAIDAAVPDVIASPADTSDVLAPPPDVSTEAAVPDVGETKPEDEASCVPDCGGKQCGPDGCGGDCGVCPPSENLCAGYRRAFRRPGNASGILPRS